WYTLFPVAGLAGRAAWRFAGALAWYAYGGLVALHYSAIATDHTSLIAPLTFAAFALAGAPLLWSAVLPLWAALAGPPPTLQTTLPRFEPDGSIIVRLRHTFDRPASIRHLRLTLACVERRGISASRLSSDTETLIANTAFA